MAKISTYAAPGFIETSFKFVGAQSGATFGITLSQLITRLVDVDEWGAGDLGPGNIYTHAHMFTTNEVSISLYKQSGSKWVKQDSSAIATVVSTSSVEFDMGVITGTYKSIISVI